jgi:energy-coupling factor transport system permease protein
MTVATGPTPATGSWLHRMSPVPKIAWMLAVFAVALVTFHLVPLLAIAAVALGLAATAGIAGRVLRVLLLLAPLAASILLIQLLAPAGCRPSCEVVATLGPLTIHAEGVGNSLAFIARLLAIQVVAFVVILTTTSPDLFAALDGLRVPRSISFASAMTLQLVPVLRRELAIVSAAQRARGLRATGPTALGRTLVPVIVASVERIEQVSISLEARGLGGSARRTSVRRVDLGRRDRLIAVAAIVAGVAGVVAGLAWWGPGTVVSIEVEPGVAIALVVGAIAVLVAALGRGLVVLLRA